MEGEISEPRMVTVEPNLPSNEVQTGNLCSITFMHIKTTNSQPARLGKIQTVEIVQNNFTRKILASIGAAHGTRSAVERFLRKSACSGWSIRSVKGYRNTNLPIF